MGQYKRILVSKLIVYKKLEESRVFIRVGTSIIIKA